MSRAKIPEIPEFKSILKESDQSADIDSPEIEQSTAGIIADLLVENGLLSKNQIRDAKQHRHPEKPKPLISFLQELSLVTEEQVQNTLRSNKIVCKIGALLVELGYVKQADLEKALKLQEESENEKKLGDILVEKKYAHEERVSEVLEYQKKDARKTRDIKDIRDLRFFLFKKTYITTGTIIAVIISVGTFGYNFVDNYLEDMDLIKTQSAQIKSNEADIRNYKTDISRLRVHVQELSKSNLPIPLPISETGSVIAELTGSRKFDIDLFWEVPEKLPESQYKILTKKTGYSLWQPTAILDPNQRKINIRLSLGEGQYQWKIEGSNGESSVTHLFSVYASVISRIQKTRTLTVATTRKKGSVPNPLDASRIEGKMARALRDGIQKYLQIDSLRLVIKELSWQDLLNEVRLGSVDMAIAGITATKEREEKYFPLRFSNAYKYNHQMFVKARTSDDAPFPEGLNGANVAIQKGSTNMEAARAVLAKKYGFNIVEYETHEDVYNAPKSIDINFSLIDSEYYKERKKDYNIVPYGKYLDKDLAKFYKTKYKKGKDIEYFAIAVHSPEVFRGHKDSFLNLVNSLISTKDFKKNFPLD
ncbi:MAG: transporter substrate-binding domain-containing protein [Acidiferrobacterales bacterium]